MMRSDGIKLALEDTRSTIRALDQKVAFLSVIILLPLTKLAAIFKICKASSSGLLMTIVIVMFSIAWCVAFTQAFLAVNAIDNPERKLVGDLTSSPFFGAGLFLVSWKVLFGFGGSNAQESIDEYLSRFPDDGPSFDRMLAIELQKLIYIRTLKMKRCKAAYISALIWVVLGGGIWIKYLW